MAPASEERSHTPQSSVLTIVAIAVTAYALCDLVHEVAGHGLAAVATPGVRLVSLSTVALQTTADGRAVAACGSIANVIVGAATLGVFHRLARFSTGAYFVWLFGALNLLNGSGYPLYSAVLRTGDWDVVIRGLQPAWVWRIGLGIIGAAAYWGSIVFSAKALTRAVKRNLVSRAEIARLVFPAYVAGGALLLVASAFNPIGAGLILSSGLSSGFAAMAGLTLVPGVVERQTDAKRTGSGFISRSPAWIATGIIVAVLFVALLGPGIDLTR